MRLLKRFTNRLRDVLRTIGRDGGTDNALLLPMSSIEMVSEQDATGRVKQLYKQIKQALGTDFVPNMFKVMAHNPELLEANWNKNQAVMKARRLNRTTKEIIAVAVSAVMGCEY